MAIDLNAIRNRLSSLQNKVQKTDNLWKPKPGKQQIRMLPYVHNTSNPFIELFFHYDFGGKNILSPKTFGEADPLIQFAEQFGKTVYQELLAFFADPDYGDLTDLTSGRDITVEFKTAKELGKNFPETYIRVKPNQTSATDDKKIMELIKDQIELPTLFKKYSYDELEASLKTWLETGKVSEEGETETQPTTDTTSEASGTKVAGVKDAFDDLFNS